MAKKSKRIKKIIKKHHLSDDALLIESYDWIVNFQNAKHTPIEIYDGVTRKVRTIIVPTMEELIVQHCIVNALKPIFWKGMYEHTYASIPGRGAHRGKKVIEKWIRNDPKNTKYVLKLDIHHFFDCVPHDILERKLALLIHDDQMLNLLYKLIDVTEQGIPLGFYTSQWLSNWYLQGLDHYIKEQLGAKYYMRYMDDMVIFGSNKKKLHKIRQAIADYLQDNLGLELKGNWQVFRFSYLVPESPGSEKLVDRGRDLDFMGFRFYRNRTVLRRTIMYKSSRKARRIHKKEKPHIYEVRQMMSYLGWINCTNTYGMYRKWIKPYVSFQNLKRRVSKYDRCDDRNVYLRLVGLYSANRRKQSGTEIQTFREHRKTHRDRNGQAFRIRSTQYHGRYSLRRKWTYDLLLGLRRSLSQAF